MSDRIARPSFYEGQVLGAADLTLGLDYTRGQMARHDRYLHTPGIATGLALTLDTSTGASQVKLSPGIAIDATGRQVLVDHEETLSPEDLDRSGVLVPDDTDAALAQEKRPWHPVFLTGLDESATPPSFSRGCGSGAQPNRMNESYVVSYGFPGETADDPPVVEVTDGPDSDAAVRILIGYVQWDGKSGFGDAKTMPVGQVPPPFAGARADEVVARSGTLALRADVGESHDKRPALVLDGEKGGELRFGLQDADGAVTTVFRVDAAGNLFFNGVIDSLTKDVWVESGAIWDGMLVPLPAGVTQEKVDDGSILLHITVTPRWTGASLPPGKTGTWLREPFEYRVEGRRVFARDRWFDVASLSTATPVSTLVPTSCHYLVLASVSGKKP